MLEGFGLHGWLQGKEKTLGNRGQTAGEFGRITAIDYRAIQFALSALCYLHAAMSLSLVSHQ